MRKFLLVLFGIAAMLGFNKVYAADIKLEYDTNINRIKPFIEGFGYGAINEAINSTINYYNTNFSKNYPYYFVSFLAEPFDYSSQEMTVDDHLYIILTALPNIENFHHPDYLSNTSNYYLYNHREDSQQVFYDMETNTIFSARDTFGYVIDLTLFRISSEFKWYYPYYYYYSNFDLYYRGSLFKDSTLYLTPDDTLFFPLLNDSTLYSVHKANTDFLIEPYYLYDNNENLKDESLITIDLNQYSYVALSLKDYSKTETFFTNVYVKGNYCITPVYNYGMTEKIEYYPGYQVDRCSPYYEDFTLVRTYILEQDLKNNAIYYLKAYDTTKDNIVKVDSSIFNITYIAEEEKDNPYVSIDGKIYPTISYDNLSSSSTKSEEEGYISGVVCQVGDFNCYVEHNPSNIFDDIFSSPLKFLEDIWESVTSIFTLITEFITLLPPMMQSFLYLSFMVAVILGLLKIIL